MVDILDRVTWVIGKIIRLPNSRRLLQSAGRCLIGLALLLVSPGPAGAGEQSLEAIREAVEKFLAGQSYSASPKIEVGRLDDRLKLPSCTVPLEVFFSPGGNRQGAVTVGVRCTEPSPWSIYVPARVEVYGKVIVAARTLVRGAVLAPEDLRFEERALSSLNGYYLSDTSEGIGRVLKRGVAAGAVVSPSVLSEPRLVHRGERVSIVVQGQGLEVRMEGEALKDGALGDVIRVRNLSSKRELEGVVTGAGVVRVRI